MPLAARLIPSACGLAVFAAIAALYAFGERDAYFSILLHWGFPVWDFPFLDWQNSVAAWECTRRGLDVSATNPCDVMGRVHNYGPGWTAFSFVPLSGDDFTWTGFLIGLLFLGSFAFLPAVKRPWHVAVMVAACLSPPVVFVVERANVDALLFMLVLGVGYVANRRPTVAYALVVLGTMYKYYPVTMLALALKERPSRLLAVIGASGVALTLYVGIYIEQLRNAAVAIPNGPYWTGFFSARNIPLGLQWFFGIPPVITVAALSFAFLLTALILVRTRSLSKWGEMPEPHRTFVVLGCSLMLGCFFVGSSVIYREIMFLLMLPGFLLMAERSKLSLATVAAVLFVMYEPVLREAFGFRVGVRINAPPIPLWVMRELAWWFLASVMFTIMVEFAARSPALALRWPWQTAKISL